MKRTINLLLVLLTALTLTACAAATNPTLDQRPASIGAVNAGP